MPVTPVKVPKTLADFMSAQTISDMQKVEDLLNALQRLKVQVNINGTSKIVNATIQISGDAALIVIAL